MQLGIRPGRRDWLTAWCESREPCGPAQCGRSGALHVLQARCRRKLFVTAVEAKDSTALIFSLSYITLLPIYRPSLLPGVPTWRTTTAVYRDYCFHLCLRRLYGLPSFTPPSYCLPACAACLLPACPSFGFFPPKLCVQRCWSVVCKWDPKVRCLILN